ncbi:thiamine pyrophosphate-binding protein [Oceaniglobus indicus]|uniref:thiamine pyrophosphate-binding protein n=1 Tax=Oceaniglobus indicus TaxID=2047749 RepID=UPI000C18EBCC|nr:thiamine pyrophosphate-binding protein [Oceaniglobus indicus]
MSDAPRAADIVARRLHAAGCRHAFGVAGGAVAALIDALDQAGIAFHRCTHENAAGFMAEGVHQVDGAPAVLVTTAGPGAMAAVNVVAQAHKDRVPLIVLTGCVDGIEAQTHTHQVLEHSAVFAPITKAAFTLDAAAAGVIADKAVAITTEGRAGPVHIDVPPAVAGAQGVAMAGRRAVPAPVIPANLSKANRWISEADRPIMIVGLDVLKDGGADTVRAFATANSIPVITTCKAKGLLSEDHPLSLGVAGLSSQADNILLPLLDQADLILCVGYDPVEMRTGWRDAWNPDETRVIDIHGAPNHHYMHHASLSFVADTGATLAALGPLPVRPLWTDGQIAAARDALAAAFDDGEAWGPAAVIALCRDVLPDDTIATVDGGAHRILISQMWRCRTPRTLLQSSGLGAMGCALPLALGVKLAAPDRPVVAFSGAAGFLRVAGELATAAAMGLPAAVVVFVDASPAPAQDVAAIGRAFGGDGVIVHDRDGLRAALDSALASDRVTVIGAAIDARAHDDRN